MLSHRRLGHSRCKRSRERDQLLGRGGPRLLNGRYGRQFADEIVAVISSGQDLATALDCTVERWMDRRADALVEEEVGFPQRLPHHRVGVHARRQLSPARPDPNAAPLFVLNPAGFAPKAGSWRSVPEPDTLNQEESKMAKTKSSTKLSAPRKAAKIEKGRGLAEASVPPRES
jgi:hypothetical protein